jgi:hypothetical protein
MNLEDFLWEKITTNKISKLAKFIDGYVTNIQSLNEFTDILINLYCNKILSRNICVLTKLIGYLETIQVNKKSLIKVRKILYDIIVLYSNIILKDNDIFIPKMDENIKNNITKISYTFKKEYNELDYLKDILLGNIYTLFNAIFGLLINHKNIEDVSLIFKYIIDLKNSQLFFGDSKSHNIYDLFFSIFEKLVLSEEYKQFFILSKILFNFNIKKKDYSKRSNILLVCFAGYIMRNINTQEIDIKPIITSNSNNNYLYTLHNYDYQKIMEIDREKIKLKTDRTLKKNVIIDNNNFTDMEFKNIIDIIKIN